MSMKVNKNGKGYPVGVVPQSLIDRVWQLNNLKSEIVSISGITSSNGTISGLIVNSYTEAFVMSNISVSLSDNYSVTVDTIREGTITLRYRNKGDNSAIANTPINDTVLILGV